MKTLLVGGDTEFSRAAEAVLSRRGHEVGWRESGYAALRAFAAEPPEMVVICGELSEVQFTCRTMRAMPGGRDCVVLLVPRGMPLGAEAVLACGVDDVVHPFSPEALDLRVQLAERRRAFPQADEPPPVPSDGRASAILSRLMDESGAAIGVTDLEGRFLSLNPAAAEISGYAAEEVIGRPFTDFLVEDQAAAVSALFRRVAQGGETVRGQEILVRHKDGHAVPIILTWSPVVVEGLIVGTAASGEEVTSLRRAEVRSRRRARGLRAVAGVARAVAEYSGRADLLDHVASRVMRMLGVDAVAVSGFDEGRGCLTLLAVAAADPVAALSRAGGLRTQVSESDALRAIIASKRPYVGYAPLHAAAFGERLTALLQADGYRTSVLLPLVHEGRLVGAAALHARSRVEHDAEDLSVYGAVADQIAVAIGNASLLEESRRSAERLGLRGRQHAFVASLGQQALEQEDLPRLLERAVHGVAAILGVSHCAVLEHLPQTDGLRPNAITGWPESLAGVELMPGGQWRHSLVGYGFGQEEPVIVDDVLTERRFPIPRFMARQGIRSGVSVRIHGQGRPYGVLVAHARRPHSFSADDVDFLKSVANVLAAAIERRQYIEALSESETRFRTLIADLDVGVLLCDGEGRVLVANTAATRLLGVEGDELLGSALREPQAGVLDEDGAPFAPGAHPIARALSTGQPVRDVVMSVRREGDGEASWLLASAEPRLDAGGTVREVVCTIVDITGRRVAESRIRLQNEYLSALHETALALLHQLDTAELLKTVIARAGALLGTEHGFIYLVSADDERLVVEVATGEFKSALGMALKQGEGMSGRVWQTGRPVVIGDYASWEGKARKFSLSPFRTLAAVPMRSGGRVTGVLGLGYLEGERAFGEEEVRILSHFSELAALAVDKARLYASAQEELGERQRAEAILESEKRVLEMMTSGASLSEVLDTLALAGDAQTEGAMCAFNLLDQSGTQLIAGAAPGLPEEMVRSAASPAGTNAGAGAAAAFLRQPVYASDIGTDPRWEGYREGPQGLGLQASWSAPIFSSSGDALGTFVMFHREARLPTPHEQRIIERSAQLGGIAIERWRSEEALRRSEEHFRSLVQHALDVTLVLRADGTISYISPSVERIFGFSPERVTGTSVREYLHPEDVAGLVPLLTGELAVDDDIRPIELRCRDAWGAWRFIEAVASNRLSDPDIRGHVINLRDISERKQAEEAVRRSEERFRALVQNGSDIITVLDVDGTIRYQSPSITRILGYSPEETLGRPVVDFIHPDDLPYLEAAMRERILDAEGVSQGEIRFLHADGTWRYLECLGTNMLREPGIEGIVVNSRDVTERKTFEEQLARQALHDPLTHLPNRALFVDRLEQAVANAARHGDRVAVMFLDVDRFKLVNDSLGHAAGDELLVAMGARMAGLLQFGDTIARFGGDEFTILLPTVTQAEDAAEVAQRLIGAARDPFVLNGHEVFVTVSIGIALSSAQTTGSADLLREADVALYRAKADGRARYVVFNPGMNARALERLNLNSDLQRAVERGEIQVAYQPEVELATGRIVAVEALARWHHPRQGLIPPEEFIPLAEESGAILDVGYWVLSEACRQAQAWQAQFPADSPLLMSVNLSARQLKHRELAARIQREIDAAALDPRTLRIEITESAAVEDTQATLNTIHALKRLGLRLAIDDFGTGYSSLSYLTRLMVDTLKIDRTFVKGLGHDESSLLIVKAVISLAHALGMDVTAEGVESPRQMELLEAVSADRAQGFYLGRPCSAEEMTLRLALAAQRFPQAV